MSSSRLRTLTKCVRYSKRIHKYQSFASPKKRFILSSIRPSQDLSHNQWTPPTSSIIAPLAISSLTETNADVQPLNKSLDPSLENVDSTNFILSSNQALLEFIHSQLDIPWWLVIVLTTLALRTCFTLPIAIYQLKSTARLVAIQPLISSWRETLKKVIANDSRVKGLSYDAYQAVLRKE
ncbi:3992_t:CDS:1, partial [Paraglomus occultum]